MTITAPIHNARAFDDWASRNPSTEASTLCHGSERRMIGPLYVDSCDVGFVLRNERTGGETRWYLAKTFRDQEGDITHWTFKPTTETVHKYPHLRTYVLTVWND